MKEGGLCPLFFRKDVFRFVFTSTHVKTQRKLTAGNVENKGVLINSITNCISRYSLEIYLCHMLVFRVLEKLHFIHALNGNEILSYIVCACFTFVGALLIAIGYSKVEKLTENIYSSRRSAK